jgi:two-component system phosphate regulon sensor histidine kinase PhoR
MGAAEPADEPVRLPEPLLDPRVQALEARIEALERAASRSAELMETNPTGMLVIDGDGRIEQANPAVIRKLDVRRPPVGRNPVEVIHVAEVLAAIADGLAGRQSGPRAAVVGDLDLLIEVVPLHPGALVSVRDVTQQRAVERARTEFVANVSHELRTPMAIVRGFAETLLADVERLPADLRPMVEAIDRNGLRLSQLFDDLLTLYRIETRRRDLPREPLQLARVLQEAKGQLSDRVGRVGLEVEVDCPPGLTAWSSRQALDTILSNLTSNACKYSPAGGMIRLVARDTGPTIDISVSDTGLGISRAHHDRIFERFYRVDDGRARKVGGTGLGLAIVKHYAQAIGATVTLASEEGKGSTFTVHLPAHAGPAPARTWDAW